MLEEGEGEAEAVLADCRLGRLGLRVTLDKGFAEGTYGVCIEYDDLAARVGFGAAHRLAVEYCTVLKHQLSRSPGYLLEATDDASRSGNPRRRRDLEATFLSFGVAAKDGRFHDAAIQEEFRRAFLRAGQAWDQSQARSQTQRRQARQERFRQELGRLLDGESYASVNAAIKARLLDEVPPLAFARRESER
jgi:hypothetical protein